MPLVLLFFLIVHKDLPVVGLGDRLRLLTLFLRHFQGGFSFFKGLTGQVLIATKQLFLLFILFYFKNSPHTETEKIMVMEGAEV